MPEIIRLRDAGLPLSLKALYKLARDGRLPGAVQLSPNGPWLIDKRALEEHFNPSSDDANGDKEVA